MGKALNLINKLKVVEFDWKETNEHDIGLIAEDVKNVLPEAIWYKNNKVEGLKPLTLIAIIIEAIKELNKKCQTKK